MVRRRTNQSFTLTIVLAMAGGALFVLVLFGGGAAAVVYFLWSKPAAPVSQVASEPATQPAPDVATKPAPATIPSPGAAAKDRGHARPDLPAEQPKQPSPPLDPKGTPTPSPTQPPEQASLEKPVVNVTLPGTIAAVVGSRDDYLILFLPEQRQIAIFSFASGKVNKSLFISEAEAQIAASADHLFVGLPKAGVIQRYELRDRYALEATLKNPVPGTLERLLIGSGSRGPLIIGNSGNAGGLFDPITLQPVAIKGKADYEFGDPMRQWRVSADGQLLTDYLPGASPQRQRFLRQVGGELKAAEPPLLAGHVVPGPEGRYVYTTRGLYVPDGNQIGPVIERGYVLPANQGETFYLGIVFPQPVGKNHLFIGTTSSGRLIDVPYVEVPDGAPADGDKLGTDQRFHFSPTYKKLVVIPKSNDKLQVYHVDVEAILKKSARDHLFFFSSPPRQIARGSVFTYTTAVRSKRGGVRLSVDHGPDRMMVDGTGKVTWRVPKEFAESEVNVLLKAKDDSGHEAFHSFKIQVTAP